MQFEQDRTQDGRIRAFESAKSDIARREYMVTVLWTGSDRFGQVSRCEALFFLNRKWHTVQIWPTLKPAGSFLTVPRSKLYDPLKGWKQRFVTLQYGVNRCEVQLFLAAHPKATHYWKALD